MSLMPLGLLSQGGGNGAAASFELISTQILVSDTATVTFSSIPSTYKHLQIRATIRGASPSNYAEMSFRINGDTGTNYVRHRLLGDGGLASSQYNSAYSYGSFGVVESSGATPSNLFAPLIVDITDYANTSKNKTIRSISGIVSAPQVSMDSNLWLSTSAITSIALSVNFGSYSLATGSRISLYGTKG